MPANPAYDPIPGDDATVRESILAGFHGTISVTANVAPRPMAEMCRAALERVGLRARGVR